MGQLIKTVYDSIIHSDEPVHKYWTGLFFMDLFPGLTDICGGIGSEGTTFHGGEFVLKGHAGSLRLNAGIWVLTF
jgi:hypothetical protein